MFEVNTKVRVTDNSQTYDMYARWAKEQNLFNWHEETLPIELTREYKIVAVAKHGIYAHDLFAIQDDAGNQFIINADGLEPVHHVPTDGKQ